GVGAALLTPGSLAMIEASFAPGDRARAVGAWSGLTGVGAALGPFLGGWLVDAGSWRLIFVLNLPLAVVVVMASRRVPESRDPAAATRIDVAGSLLAVVGLAALTFGLIGVGPDGALSPVVLGSVALGCAALAGF